MREISNWFKYSINKDHNWYWLQNFNILQDIHVKGRKIFNKIYLTNDRKWQIQFNTRNAIVIENYIKQKRSIFMNFLFMKPTRKKNWRYKKIVKWYLWHVDIDNNANVLTIENKFLLYFPVVHMKAHVHNVIMYQCLQLLSIIFYYSFHPDSFSLK